MDIQAYSARKLLSAFGVRPRPAESDQPDDSYYKLLGWALSRELRKRVKLPQHNTVDDVVKLIQTSNNIIVITGAGISTSLGIPDFRSKDIGLYAKVAHLGLADAQDVFDIGLFKEDPTVFYSVARDILPSIERFTPTHAFIKLLQDKGKLLTNYSQNIDNIESAAGIKPEKLIQCHGSFATASCIKCHHQVPGETIFPDIRDGRIPKCTRCTQNLRAARAPAGMKRKRSSNGDKKKRQRWVEGQDDSTDEEDYDMLHEGIMKPDITFFGEQLPDVFSERLTNHDRHLVDLVIVIGTSLKVAPVSEVVPYLHPSIPQVYISRTPVSHVEFDVDMLGDCDVVVAELCKRAGWDLKHEMIPKDQKIVVKREDGFASRYSFTVQTLSPCSSTKQVKAEPSEPGSSNSTVNKYPREKLLGKPSEPMAHGSKLSLEESKDKFRRPYLLNPRHDEPKQDKPTPPKQQSTLNGFLVKTPKKEEEKVIKDSQESSDVDEFDMNLPTPVASRKSPPLKKQEKAEMGKENRVSLSEENRRRSH